MNKPFIGNNTESPILAYENALLFYVYGRVTLNTNWFMFLLPAIFYFYHHAIEVSIKTLLKLKNVRYPSHGQDGHKIYSLLVLAVNSNCFSDKVNKLLQDSKLIELLQVMESSNGYLKNKYDYPGYMLQGVSLRDPIDKIIFVLFEEIDFLLKNKNHALATFSVPMSVEKMFLFDLQNIPTYTVIDMRDY